MLSAKDKDLQKMLQKSIINFSTQDDPYTILTTIKVIFFLLFCLVGCCLGGRCCVCVCFVFASIACRYVSALICMYVCM